MQHESTTWRPGWGLPCVGCYTRALAVRSMPTRKPGGPCLVQAQSMPTCTHAWSRPNPRDMQAWGPMPGPGPILAIAPCTPCLVQAQSSGPARGQVQREQRQVAHKGLGYIAEQAPHIEAQLPTHCTGDCQRGSTTQADLWCIVV